MATAADIEAALAEVGALTDDLAKWFNINSADFQKMSDMRAARCAAMMVGASKAAKRLGAGISVLGDTINEVMADSAAAHAGAFSEPFSGAAGQTVTHPITGSWITTSTVPYGFSSELGTSAYYGMFDVWADNIAAGSFDLKCRNTGAAPVGTYFFRWIAV
jgi:hypothetical protein